IRGTGPYGSEKPQKQTLLFLLVWENIYLGIPRSSRMILCVALQVKKKPSDFKTHHTKSEETNLLLLKLSK
ncbi:hypothetical protein, partial [Pseudomonas poae]|uniref:hypothetical protein n=1 Tax=Pseudomonas poae TaxID=200451 RepID=UPI0034D62A07